MAKFSQPNDLDFSDITGYCKTRKLILSLLQIAKAYIEGRGFLN